MKINGLKMPIETILMAGSYDKLAYILWTKTEDAVKGINQPASILDILTGKEQEKKVMAFESIEEFEKYRNSFFE